MLKVLLFLTLRIKWLKAKEDACSKSSKFVESHALCTSKFGMMFEPQGRRQGVIPRQSNGERIFQVAKESQRGQSARLLTAGCTFAWRRRGEPEQSCQNVAVVFDVKSAYQCT